MLIDMIETCKDNIQVISANTDGILIHSVISLHVLHSKFNYYLNGKKRTGFVTEESEYSSIYSRDVNNYIAIKKDGKCKVKGSYSERGSSGDSPLSRNPEAFICNDAAIAYLVNNTPVEETINACKDIRRFVVVRNVKGGAIKSGIFLGQDGTMVLLNFNKR